MCYHQYFSSFLSFEYTPITEIPFRSTGLFLYLDKCFNCFAFITIMFLRLKTFLMSCFATVKEGNTTSAVMVSSTQQDPLIIIGKYLQETTLRTSQKTGKRQTTRIE